MVYAGEDEVNFTQNQLFQGAWKSAVGVITGAALTNVADSAYPIFSLLWWKHLCIAVGVLLITTEGRYWNQWDNSGTERPLPQAIGAAQDLAKKTEDAIADVKDAAKKP